MTSIKSIHWFRQDLRLKDNPAFFEACALGQVLPIFIHDHKNDHSFKIGSASKCWLHYALLSLNQSLNGSLRLYMGDPVSIINQLIKHNNIDHIFYNRCYEPHAIKQENELKSALHDSNIFIKSHNGNLLFEPEDIMKDDGTNYRVFTPFFKKCLEHNDLIREPLNEPSSIIFIKDKSGLATTIKSLKLMPDLDWGERVISHWQVSEKDAKKRLNDFIKGGLSNYKEGRDYPALEHVSRLSPYLHFGQISPNQVYYSVMGTAKNKDRDHFISELCWREFSYNLLKNYPSLPKKNLQTKFDNFSWAFDKKHLEAWQQGLTGYPIVDAGMRELWQTGYMHNRVRMIVASFLTKNLLIHWHKGEQWFWDCLVDADLANNSASWQWVAGSGADAAPYFRIFNPITQGEKFDKEGVYTKNFVPELRKLPAKYIHKPFTAPSHILKEADITLGLNYPLPIIDLKWSRERALQTYFAIKS